MGDKPHIQVVEDDPRIAGLLSMGLTQAGYRVSVADRPFVVRLAVIPLLGFSPRTPIGRSFQWRSRPHFGSYSVRA